MSKLWEDQLGLLQFVRNDEASCAARYFEGILTCNTVRFIHKKAHREPKTPAPCRFAHSIR